MNLNKFVQCQHYSIGMVTHQHDPYQHHGSESMGLSDVLTSKWINMVLSVSAQKAAGFVCLFNKCCFQM